MELDEDVVNPKRFAIITLLLLFKRMTEGDLAKAVGISWGSLSSHLRRLEERGYIRRKRAITAKGIRTIVEITDAGDKRYREEAEKLKNLLDNIA